MNVGGGLYLCLLHTVYLLSGYLTIATVAIEIVVGVSVISLLSLRMLEASKMAPELQVTFLKAFTQVLDISQLMVHVSLTSCKSAAPAQHI